MSKSRWLPGPVALALALLSPSAAGAGEGITEVEVAGDTLEARIVLPGGVEAGLTIEFESVSGLSAESLGLSAELVDPSDPALIVRLPDPVLVSVPAAFPVLLRAQPQPGVTMHGVATVSLDTHDLTYSASSRLRVFAAPPGGPFEDVTAEDGPGSYRGGTVTPQFAMEWMIVDDERLVDWVAALKVTLLELALGQHAGAMPPLVAADLATRLDDVRAAFEAGDYAAALTALDAFSEQVEAHSGQEIPDLWSSVGGSINAAGDLRARAATLGYSLLDLAAGAQ